MNARMASQFHQCCILMFHSSAINGMYHNWIKHISFAGLLLGHDHFLLNSFVFIIYHLLHRQLCVVREHGSVIKQNIKNYGVNYCEISERVIRPVALPLTLWNVVLITRGSVRSTRGLGPTMTARGQSIGISIGMLPQTLIMCRLDQLSRLGARI